MSFLRRKGFHLTDGNGGGVLEFDPSQGEALTFRTKDEGGGSTSYGQIDTSSEVIRWSQESLLGGGFNEETLSADKTLGLTDATLQRLDPGGSSRDVDLPAEGDSQGKSYRIVNTADAAEDLVVKDDGGSTVATVSQNEAAWFFCNGTAWKHGGIETIAQS